MNVNQKELAAILGLTDRRIRQLKSEYGLFSSDAAQVGEKQKKYKLEVCIPEYINYRIEAETQQGTSIIREKEQAEHEQIKKKISILKLRKLKRELHEAADVECFLTDMLINFKKRLIGVPQKVAPLVVGEDDANVIVGILEKEIYQVLDQLSEYDPMKIDKDDVAAILDEEEEDEE